MHNNTLDQIRKYRQIITEGNSVPLTEAPTETEVNQVRQLIDGPNGEKWLDYAARNSEIARSHVRDLLTLSPEQFGRKYRRENAYVGGYANEVNAAERVRDVAERWRDYTVNRVVKARQQHGEQQQPQRAQGQEQQPRQSQQPQRQQGRATMDPIYNPGDRQQPQQQKRSGGSSQFNAAFKQARVDGKTQFEFGGKSYTTQRENEDKPFWRAKMKFLRSPNELTADEIKTLRDTPQGLGPNEKKQLDQLAGQTGAATGGSARSASRPQQSASTGGTGGDQAAQSDLARWMNDNPERRDRVISKMREMGLIEKRTFHTNIITEALTQQELLSILSNPNHPEHEAYATKFRQIDRQLHQQGAEPSGQIDAEVARLKKEDAAFGYTADKAKEIYRNWRSQGKTIDQIQNELASKGYDEWATFWRTSSRPYRSLWTMMVGGGLIRDYAALKSLRRGVANLRGHADRASTLGLMYRTIKGLGAEATDAQTLLTKAGATPQEIQDYQRFAQELDQRTAKQNA